MGSFQGGNILCFSKAPEALRRLSYWETVSRLSDLSPAVLKLYPSLDASLRSCSSQAGSAHLVMYSEAISCSDVHLCAGS
jgi:hypothetical protein